MRLRCVAGISVTIIVGSTAAAPVCKIFGLCGEDECQVYLAPSTIENAGLGVFTAKALERGEAIGNGDIAIPIIDMVWHVGKGHRYFWHFRPYVWQGWYMGMHAESEDLSRESVTAFLPGLDAAINCNPALLNAGKSTPIHDSAGLHRSRDPGAGAFTPYYNGTTTAREPIPAGGELFKYYGDAWFESREGMERIPFYTHYLEAQRIMNTFATFAISQEGMESLWDVVKADPWESRLGYALPATATEALKGAAQGVRSLHQPSATRSIDYLVKEGRCMDSIRAGLSTNRGAGRGAFATRFYSAGSIVTGSPLLHVPDRDILVMYGVEEGDKSRLKRNVSNVVGTQLLINYCFGHEDSTLLLCPYGSGVGYINHNASEANVKIEFSPDGIINQNNKWFQLEVHEMEWNFDVGIAFDYVATRDILPGEEIFLDYGDEWEHAWEIHVRNWKPPPRSERYVSARDFNEQTRDAPIRTVLEQQLEPYPKNVRLMCHSRVVGHLDHIGSEWAVEERGVTCDVIDRTNQGDGVVYVVKVGGGRVENVTRNALRFIDVPYSTDIYLHNAFRHEMMIPDTIFPKKWRNRAKKRN